MIEFNYFSNLIKLVVEPLLIIEIGVIIVGSILCYVLIQQYRFTKVFDFLIFSSGFFLFIPYNAIDVYYNLIYFQPYDGSIPIPLYITLQKIILILNILLWPPLFYIG